MVGGGAGLGWEKTETGDLEGEVDLGWEEVETEDLEASLGNQGDGEDSAGCEGGLTLWGLYLVEGVGVDCTC